jgi:thymidine kinase
VPSGDRVLLGAQGTYEARCRVCFDPTLSRENPKAQIPKPKSQEV